MSLPPLNNNFQLKDVILTAADGLSISFSGLLFNFFFFLTQEEVDPNTLRSFCHGIDTLYFAFSPSSFS